MEVKVYGKLLIVGKPNSENVKRYSLFQNLERNRKKSVDFVLGVPLFTLEDIRQTPSRLHVFFPKVNIPAYHPQNLYQLHRIVGRYDEFINFVS